MNKTLRILLSVVAGGLVLIAIRLITTPGNNLLAIKARPLNSESAELPLPAALSLKEMVAPTGLSEDGAVSADDLGRTISLYTTNCSSCHGLAGRGSNIAPPLNRPELRRIDDSFLYTTIAAGRPGTAMPAWGNRLNQDEISALVALIRAWETSTATDLPRFTEQDIGPGYGRRGMGHGMMGGGRGMGHGMMSKQDR